VRAAASAWRMQHELPPASQRLGVQTVEISFKSAAAAAAVGAARHAPRHRRGQTACDPLALFVAWYGSARALRPELHAAWRHATAGEASPTGDKTVSKSNCRKVDLRCGNKNGSLKKCCSFRGRTYYFRTFIKWPWGEHQITVLRLSKPRAGKSRNRHTAVLSKFGIILYRNIYT
jgi:hypothetical protein